MGTRAVILGSLLCHDILRAPRALLLKRGLITAEPGIELRLDHPAFPFQMGIIRPVEILSLLADEQVDVVGKVLGQGKTLESVCNEVFLQGEKVWAENLVPQEVQTNRWVLV